MIVSSVNVKNETNGNGISGTMKEAAAYGVIPTQYCSADGHLVQVEKEIKF